MKEIFIKTLLLAGKLDGPKLVEIPGDEIRAIVIPRLTINKVAERNELHQPALYFLINADEQRVYIGESEKFAQRVVDHLNKKDWWAEAIIFVSSANNLEKNNIKFLEQQALEKAKFSSMKIENHVSSHTICPDEFNRPHLMRTLEKIELILNFLGYVNIFSESSKSVDYWQCQSKLTDAKAIFRGSSFVVMAKSKIDLSVTDSLKKSQPNFEHERRELLSRIATFDTKNKIAILEKNLEFKTANAATVFVTGKYVNAWITWKNKDGKTMDEVMRKEKK
jgi:hypothetical protein